MPCIYYVAWFYANLIEMHIGGLDFCSILPVILDYYIVSCSLVLFANGNNLSIVFGCIYRIVFPLRGEVQPSMLMPWSLYSKLRTEFTTDKSIGKPQLPCKGVRVITEVVDD